MFVWWDFFVLEWDKFFKNFIWQYKSLKVVVTMSKNILGRLVLPDFKAIGGKIMWHWCRARGIIRENSESSETDPVYMDIWFKTEPSGKDTLNLMVIAKLVIHMEKKYNRISIPCQIQ